MRLFETARVPIIRQWADEFAINHQSPYDAFKSAEQGDEKDAGIELVKLRGTSSVARKKRNSTHLGSGVGPMPKMGKLI
jgi:hypothetical protein